MQRRKSWGPEEDNEIRRLVQLNGLENWQAVAEGMAEAFGEQSRTSKQCRERWTHQLSPSLRKGPWSEAEEDMLFQKHFELGNKWIQIAEYLPGRSDNSIKNYFYSTLRKALRRALKQLPQQEGDFPLHALKPFVLSKILDSHQSSPDGRIYFRVRKILLAMSRAGRGRSREELRDQALQDQLLQLLGRLLSFNCEYINDKEEKAYFRATRKKRKYTRAKKQAKSEEKASVSPSPSQEVKLCCFSPVELMKESHMLGRGECEAGGEAGGEIEGHEVQSEEVLPAGTTKVEPQPFNCSRLSNVSYFLLNPSL